MICLVAILVAIPITPDEKETHLIGFLGMVIPILGVRLTRGTAVHTPQRRMHYVLMGMGAVVVLYCLHLTLGGQLIPTAVGYSTVIAYLGMTAFLLIRFMFTSQEVTVDMLCGALAAYLLIGLTYSVGYALLLHLNPNSIKLDQPHRFVDLVYFSFITLLTIGYGDITPVSPAARIMTVVEGIHGMAFNTIVLASLVGILATSRLSSKS